MATLKIDLPYKKAQETVENDLPREIMEMLLAIRDIDSLLEILPPWMGLVADRIDQMGLTPEFDEFYQEMVETAGMDPTEFANCSNDERRVVAVMSLLSSYHEASWMNNREALEFLSPYVTMFITESLEAIPRFILQSMKTQLETIIQFESELGR